MNIEDLDIREARTYFRVPSGALDEILCRRVVDLVGTGVQYLALSFDESRTMHTWAVGLGGLPPRTTKIVNGRLATDTRSAARDVAGSLVETVGADRVRALANKLYPAGRGRDTVDVMTALGTRVYDAHLAQV